ncbi:Interleukin-1 receptor-associated kinase 4 [Tritrichomonas musculus]|uniref:Interleukin-1 receptor-associated kinase 4 n=1 Tax=Tritrichomonas musculus TaxID=1915356 RepID=A0ABR2INP7_9EUKA
MEKIHENLKFSYSELPARYNSSLIKIRKEIKAAYDKFEFHYFSFSKLKQIKLDEKIEIIKKSLFSFLEDNKFITCQISTNKLNNDVNAVFCVEKRCFIIELIPNTIVKTILNENKSEILQISSDLDKDSDDESDVNNFCLKYNISRQNNVFLKATIKPIILFLIRRFDYPTNFFKDPSFFNFDNEINPKEEKMKKNLLNFLQLKNIFKIHTEGKKLPNSVNFSIDEDKHKKIYEFDDQNLIKIKDICPSKVFLVLHIPSFYLFVMKLVNIDKYRTDFDQNYSHRCFTRFYGFDMSKGKIIGLVYEYMSNGSLKNFISKNDVNPIFQFTSLMRIYQGLKFLQKNSLIHRDLKPGNILIDHDWNAYISDFETIRSTEEDISKDCGSVSFASPEQFAGVDEITFKTDIYSFGGLIYVLFEKKDWFDVKRLSVSEIDQLKKNNNYPEMTNCTEKICQLYHQCIKNNQNERPGLEKIKNVICEETKPGHLLNEYLLKIDVEPVSVELMIQYLIENIQIRFIPNRLEEIQNYFDSLIEFHDINMLCQTSLFDKYEFVTKEKYPKTINRLGCIYYVGDHIKTYKDKAIKYWQKLEDYNYAISLFNSGVYYFNDEKNYSKAREYFEKAANQNEANSFYFLGRIYYVGYGVTHDFAKAKYYLEKAAEQGNSESLNLLGVFYLAGLSVEKDESIAFFYFEQAAEKGSITAIINLGDCYENGIYVDIDYNKAKYYYELGLEENVAEAYLKLGNLYYYGLGVESNKEIAKEMYEKASKLGNAHASYTLAYLNSDTNLSKSINLIRQVQKQNDFLSQNYSDGFRYFFNSTGKKQLNNILSCENSSLSHLLLGNMYNYGINNEQNYGKGKEFYELLANKNEPEGFLRLGELYFLGNGVEQDFNKAKECFEKSIELYNEESTQKVNYMAHLDLGLLYYIYGFGLENNYQIAKEHFEISANEHNLEANLMLGNLYFNGKGVEVDYKKAFEYYKTVLQIDNNNFVALYYIGKMYLDGVGVDKDDVKAKKYFELSAKNNCIEALVKLGNIYYKGKGTAKDLSLAIFYYQKAADFNNPKAQYKLGMIYLNKKNDKKTYEKAKIEFEKASKSNYSKAYLMLGDLYKDGLGVNKNYFKALMMYNKSFEINRNRNAIFNIGYFYEKGFGVYQDYPKAVYYYELAAQYLNQHAILKLENLYPLRKGIDIDTNKIFNYLNILIEMDKNQRLSNETRMDGTFYIAKNNLGLIHLTIMQNNDLACQYIKEAALNRYPFGQNNYGLLCQFYLNKNDDAIYWFTNSIKNNFVLAFYNLGYYYEKEGNVEMSIDYYIKASNHENEPLMFQGREIFDKQLEISKIFILCLTNLKLARYYSSQNNISLVKDHFVKAFAKLVGENVVFCHQKINEKIEFSFLREIIFNFPDFDFPDQIKNNKKESIELNSQENHHSNSDTDDDDIDRDKTNYFEVDYFNENLFKKKMLDINENGNTNGNDSDNNDDYYDEHINDHNEEENDDDVSDESVNDHNEEENDDEIIFLDSSDFIDFVFQNREYRLQLYMEIESIIDEMNIVLYKKPYQILFGRIINQERKSSTRERNKRQFIKKDINELFYDGFGIDIYF